MPDTLQFVSACALPLFAGLHGWLLGNGVAIGASTAYWAAAVFGVAPTPASCSRALRNANAVDRESATDYVLAPQNTMRFSRLSYTTAIIPPRFLFPISFLRLTVVRIADASLNICKRRSTSMDSYVLAWYCHSSSNRHCCTDSRQQQQQVNLWTWLFVVNVCASKGRHSHNRLRS